MRLIARPYIWIALFVAILLHVCVHTSRAQCSGGYCPGPRPAPAVVLVPAPAYVAQPAPVLYWQAAPCQAVRYRTAPARPRRFRLFRGCR